MFSIHRTLLAFFCCAFLLASSSLQGQGVGGGLHLAVVTSQIDGDAWGGFNKWGYQFGGFATYDFNDRLGLQVEINHSHRGSREIAVQGRINLNYIDVPLLLQYKKVMKNGLAIAEGGLSANLLLSANTGFPPFKQDQTEIYKRLSTELHLGAAYYFVEKVGLYARWSLGLSNLNNTPARRPWFTIHYLSLGLRVKFQ